MHLELFWVHKDFFSDAAGFSVFSTPHLLWLAFLAVLTAGYAVCYRRSGEIGQDNLRKMMALFLILFDIFKMCVMALTSAPIRQHLPLELCSLSEYTILMDALWPESRLPKQLMAFAFLPAAVMALVFPTVTAYPPISFYAIHQFLFHAGIVAYVIARYAAGEIRPNYAGLWLSVLVIGILSVPVYLLNLRFDTNYMFLMAHKGNPVLKLLWNLSGGQGGLRYVFALVLFISLVLHIVFGIYTLIGRSGKTKRSPVS